MEHPAWRRGLGRSEAKKLICMKRKGGRERKQVAQRKRKSRLRGRAALGTQARSRHASPLPAAPAGGGGSPPQCPARGRTAPLWVRVHFKKTHEQNLKAKFELNPSFRIFNYSRCFKTSPSNHIYGLIEKTLETDDPTHPLIYN